MDRDDVRSDPFEPDDAVYDSMRIRLKLTLEEQLIDPIDWSRATSRMQDRCPPPHRPPRSRSGFQLVRGWTASGKST
jgi:hypothetical protein